MPENPVVVREEETSRRYFHGSASLPRCPRRREPHRIPDHRRKGSGPRRTPGGRARGSLRARRQPHVDRGGIPQPHRQSDRRAKRAGARRRADRRHARKHPARARLAAVLGAVVFHGGREFHSHRAFLRFRRGRDEGFHSRPRAFLHRAFPGGKAEPARPVRDRRRRLLVRAGFDESRLPASAGQGRGPDE